MKAISTKYHGATNTRGSRISADDGDGNRISIPYPHELSGEAVHRKAAEALRDKMKWNGELIGGATKSGYCFVFTDSPLPRRGNPRRRTKKRVRFERDYTPEQLARPDSIFYKRLAARKRKHSERGFFPKRRKNPTAHSFARQPNQDDLNAAARGIGMLKMSIAELRDLAQAHTKAQPLFADTVIVKAAKQMIAAKKRAGARENPVNRIKADSTYTRLTAGHRIQKERAWRKHKRQFPNKDANFFVQVKRNKKWMSLAEFYTKAGATDYGRALKHRYPSKSFRVFW